MSVLDIQNLQINYVSKRGTAHAVRDLSLTINKGETFGLVGESGCGKSTVALSIMRYLPKQARVKGKILFQGQDLMQTDEEQLRHFRGNRIAMVYQDPQSSLNPVLNIGTQLTEVLYAHERMSQTEARNRVMAMLDRVHLPDPKGILERYPHQLSGGMQQRVVIAMALLLKPDLVVMDEPTTGLDVTVEAGVLDLLDDLRRDFNMAVLYISHNLGVVARICDRVGVMYAGELVEQADKESLFSQPHHPYTLGLLRCLPEKETRYTNQSLYSIPGRVPPLTALPQGCIFASRCALAESACTVHTPKLESVAEDHSVRCFRWQTVVEQPSRATFTTVPLAKVEREAKKDLLQVKKLKIYFQQAMSMLGIGKRAPVQAVDGVSFELGSQRTLGIVGESGCGKSTIARGLAGLATITDGNVQFGDSDFTQPLEKRTHKALQQLQMVFQNPDSSLNPRHTIRQSLQRPLKLFKVVPPEQEEEHLIGLLKSVNLDESYLDRRPKQLSGGEKQRVAIARAFAGNPQLVLCDEPISSLDVSVQAAVLNLLQRLQRERKVALLFISHDLNVVRYLCDEVAVVYLGRICEIGAAEAIFNPPYHPYTEALVSAIATIDQTETKAIRLQGTVPSPANPPTGCRFHTRCPRKIGAICETHEPPARISEAGHTIYCHIPLEELTAMQTENVGV